MVMFAFVWTELFACVDYEWCFFYRDENSGFFLKNIYIYFSQERENNFTFSLHFVLCDLKGNVYSQRKQCS